MSDIIRIDHNARRSRVVVHGGMVFLAGQVVDDKTAPMADSAWRIEIVVIGAA